MHEKDPEMDLHSKQESEKTSNRKNVCVKNVVSYFRQYCDASSIHGFRYFGESRTICEKLWWFIIFVVCLTLCGFCILSVYRKWDRTPVIVSFSTKDRPISDIPFPAVTVCSESKVNQTVFDYSSAIERKMNNETLTEEEETYLNALSYVCKHRSNINYSRLNDSKPEDILEALRKVSHQFSVINCIYMNTRYSCKKLFTPIVTDEGFCYTFNILDRSEIYNQNVEHFRQFHHINVTSEHWNMETGYSKNAPILAYPRRALLSEDKYGLKFVLKSKYEGLETMCRGSIEGFRILLHTPIRIPHPSLRYIRIPYNQAISASIRASQITTSATVQNYSPEKRQCYFPSEKKLKYFKIYSQSNCNTECLTNATLLLCKCVIFDMPRGNGTRICQAADYECTQGADFFSQNVKIYDEVSPNNIKLMSFLKKYSCRCLPMCSGISYQMRISQAKWNWAQEIQSGYYVVKGMENVSNYRLSKVNIFFSNGNFIGSERNEFYGPTDFLANFGGLLGLFSGFSVLSLMEIIYFLSLRLICNIRLYGNWSG